MRGVVIWLILASLVLLGMVARCMGFYQWWKYEVASEIYSQLTLDSNNIYFGDNGKEFSAIDRYTGKLKWQVNTPSEVFEQTIVGGWVIFPSGNKVFSVDRKNREREVAILNWKPFSRGKFNCGKKCDFIGR